MADEQPRVIYDDPNPVTPEVPEYNFSEVPEDIANYTTQGRRKMYGKHIREALFRPIELLSIVVKNAFALVEKNEERQTALEERFEAQIQGSTSISEVIDARQPATGGAYGTLKQRLDAMTVTANTARDDILDMKNAQKIKGHISIASTASDINMNNYVEEGVYTLNVASRAAQPPLTTTNLPNIPNFYGHLIVRKVPSGSTGYLGKIEQEIVGYQWSGIGSYEKFTVSRICYGTSTTSSWYPWKTNRVIIRSADATAAQWLELPEGTQVLVG